MNEQTFPNIRVQTSALSIECADCEELDAIIARVESHRALFFPSVSNAPSVRAYAPACAPSETLRELLRARGIGFKYRPDGKDRGETLESALSKACEAAGIDKVEIDSAMAKGETLSAEVAPDISEVEGDGL